MDRCSCTYTNRIVYCNALENEYFTTLEEIMDYAGMMENGHLVGMLENTIKQGYKLSKDGLRVS